MELDPEVPVPKPLSSRFPLGSFALVLPLAFACGGGSSSPTAPVATPMPTLVTVEIQDSAYSPKSVVVQPGDRVRWVFRGSLAGHTVSAEDGSFDSGFVFTQSGATYERVFGTDLAGRTITYKCNSHYFCCQMQGSVRVGSGAPPPPPGY
jgi:plastocyanin